MTVFAMAMIVLVVPGYSGVATLDKTGTTRFEFAAGKQKVHENKAISEATSEDTERAGVYLACLLTPYSDGSYNTKSFGGLTL